MKAMNFTLTDKLIEECRELHKETGLSMSEIVRRALEDYIKRSRRTKGR